MSFQAALESFGVDESVLPDQSEAQSSAGYTPPAAGIARLRLIGYIELGKQKNVFDGVTSYRDKVQLVFELHGKHWPVETGDDGKKRVQRMTITESKSLSKKANYWKLFTRMRNGRENIKHMSQMLGEGFLGEIVHTKKGDKVYANLRNEEGYTIRPPVVFDAETEENRPIKVPAPVAESPMLFLWDNPTIQMWESIAIPGEYDDGYSKDRIRGMILGAQNFDGSELQALLLTKFGAVPVINLKPRGQAAEAKKEEPEQREPAGTDALKGALSAEEPRRDPGLDDLDDDIPF